MYFGLVGKSCSGKNYVGELFKQQGFCVLDLDQLCHRALKLKENIIAVKEAFGSEVLKADGSVSRKALGKVVFDNPQKRAVLENILYSWLRKEIVRLACPVTFLNGALLRRSGLDKECQFIVYVDAPYQDRLERALKRDQLSEEDFAKREAAQQDVDFRDIQYRAPLVVILNDKATKEAELIRQINAICDRIRAISTTTKRNETNEEK